MKSHDEPASGKMRTEICARVDSASSLRPIKGDEGHLPLHSGSDTSSQSPHSFFNLSFFSRPKTTIEKVGLGILLGVSLVKLGSSVTAASFPRVTSNSTTGKIQWSSCGSVGERALECASLDVPLDQFSSSPSQTGFNIPLVRLRGKNSTETSNIFVNPGGPGGSGTALVYSRGAGFLDTIGEDFNILGFEPRGINASTPAAACYSSNELRKKLSTYRNEDLVRDSGEVAAWTTNYVKACADIGGESAKYVNSPQTAADMNSILEAIGQEKLNYWGFSYGTVLGQTFATMYPERVGRVIIDAVVDISEWYGSKYDSGTFKDTDKVWDGFFQECASAGAGCPLAVYGSTAEEMKKAVFDFGEKLKKQPMSVYLSKDNWVSVTYQTIFLGVIFNALFATALWPTLAAGLVQLLGGDASFFYMLAQALLAPSQANDAQTFVVCNDGITGAENWTQDREQLVEEMAPYLNKSIFGNAMSSNYYRKQKWTIPKTHNFTAETNVETATPILIMSNKYDPVCPLASAQGANKVFTNSRIVEINGYGHAAINSASECANKYVKDYFNDGVLPEKNVECAIDRSVFPSAAPTAQVAAASKLNTDLESFGVFIPPIRLHSIP